MAAQKQDDQHERTFSSYVRIRDVVLKTYLGRWTIGRSGERGSGISVLPARYDDDYSIVYIIMLATIVKSDQKAPFSIATSPRCRGGCYSFPWIDPLYPWYVPFFYCWVLSKKVSSTIFGVFGMTRPGIEPRSPGSLANTLPSRSMSRTLAWWLEYSPIARETWVQSQVESYQRLKKW